MAQEGKSEMYTKSAADFNHYIIHMYGKQCIIYEIRMLKSSHLPSHVRASNQSDTLDY